MSCTTSSIPKYFASRDVAAGWLLLGASALSACGSDNANPVGGSGAPAVAGSGGATGGSLTGGSGGSGVAQGGTVTAGGVPATSGGMATGGSSNSSGGSSGSATGGASGMTTGGASMTGGVAGATSAAGQGGTAGNSGAAGERAGGADTAAGAGGKAGATGGTPSTGGALGTGGAGGKAGTGGQAGAPTAGAGGGSVGPFVCNQATGGKLISELFNAGFESALDKDRWQLKWRDGAAIEEWANAQSPAWSAATESNCTQGAPAPDRIVFMVFSWTVKTQADWRTKITQVVNNFKSKYPSVKRIDFMNQITGPNNMLCPIPPGANETIVVSPEMKAAMDEVAAAFPGFVFLSPRWEAHSCSDFNGGGPHLTTAGNMAAAGPAAAYFAKTQ